MFALIITIISIALVAALALASIAIDTGQWAYNKLTDSYTDPVTGSVIAITT